MGMSPPISSAIKERVIQLHLEGKGRNEIVLTLNLSHIRISQGSVTNILRTYKAKASEPCYLRTSPTSETKEQIPVSEGPDSGQEPSNSSAPRGPPLPTTTKVASPHSMLSLLQLQSKWLPYSNFSPNYLLNYPGYLFSPSPQVSEVEVPTQVQTDSNGVQTGPTPSSSHSSDDSWSGQEEPSSTVELEDDLWQSRLFRQIMEEKEHRRQELLLIRREKEQVNRDKCSLEEHRKQVEAREARLFELEGKVLQFVFGASNMV